MWYRHRPVNEWRVIAVARVLTRQYLYRPAIAAHAKLYMTS